MSKWRPTASGCLYVISDIHGSYNMLEKICARILPLRTTGGVQDKIIFLGDYIDRHEDSCLVIDKIIELKKKYGDNVICLIGNHELMLIETLDLGYKYNYSGYFPVDSFNLWKYNGGLVTLMGYIKQKGMGEEEGFYLPRNRVKDMLPDEHIKFVSNLDLFHETDDYIFVHGGYDAFGGATPQETGVEELTWDRSLFNSVKRSIVRNTEIPWEKTIIAGHSHKGPVIRDKYMMLDCGAPKKLLVVELNSAEAFMAYPDKDRLVKFELEETALKKPAFQRAKTP